MTDMYNMTDMTVTDQNSEEWESIFQDVANVVRDAPLFARERLQAAQERLQELQDKARRRV